MLLQSLRALCNSPRGAGSIWKYFKALVGATRVSGRFAYDFQTDLHFADGHALGGRDRVNSEMRLEAVIEGVGRYTWRP